jgi:hypothetical protein
VQGLDGDLTITEDAEASGVMVEIADGPFEQQLSFRDDGVHLSLRPRRFAASAKGSIALVVPEEMPITAEGCGITWRLAGNDADDEATQPVRIKLFAA